MTVDFVLVPGFCSVGEIVYRELVEQLRVKLPQSTSHVVNLPSVDAIATKANLEPNGLEADISAIRSKIQSLLTNGKSVIVIAHSYGGTPALYACEGYWKKQLPSGAASVIKAALVSSSLTLPGGSVAGDRQAWKQENGEDEDPSAQLEQHGKELFIIPTGFEHAWMNDLPSHEKLRASLRPSPMSSVTTAAPQADAKNWDIAYMITTELDLAMPEPFQKYLVDRAKEHGANIKHDSLKSGHFVQVSHADEIAEWVANLV